MSEPFPPEQVLKLVQMRRNLRGTIAAADQALRAIEDLLGLFKPACKICLLERGLLNLCTCEKKIGVDNVNRRA